MNEVKLSIITINLNNKAGLEKTIESVVSQTFTDFEYIIIDGGSKDGSLDVIEKYKKHFTYWVSEPDKGIYNAMNKGIVVAKGAYCLFLNSGDLLVNSIVLEKVFEINSKNDFIYGNYYIQKENEKILQYQPKTISLDFLSNFALCHQSFFIKKTLFELYGLYDENLEIVSDWKFFIQTIVIKNCTTKYLSIPICIYDFSGFSSNETNQNLLIFERQNVKKELFPLKIWEISDELYQLKDKLNGIESSGFFKLWKSINRFRVLRLIKRIFPLVF